ncbi:hypothetical protein Zmor_024074 [Zophobas morio]|uniref:Uncharacterized protein n=1 Tax=Zophobas morio TaxID=2755281 RepID=A0AA38HZP0_9CUCU|nr:hypothetical protein Zmor_024074 [Zophobas morio]
MVFLKLYKTYVRPTLQSLSNSQSPIHHLFTLSSDQRNQGHRFKLAKDHFITTIRQFLLSRELPTTETRYTKKLLTVSQLRALKLDMMPTPVDCTIANMSITTR